VCEFQVEQLLGNSDDEASGYAATNLNSMSHSTGVEPWCDAQQSERYRGGYLR
jgi:hypothetical protein